jgi:hypothetical protein
MEISQALRDCHVAKPARKRNLLPKRGGKKTPLAAKTAGDSDG